MAGLCQTLVLIICLNLPPHFQRLENATRIVQPERGKIEIMKNPRAQPVWTILFAGVLLTGIAGCKKSSEIAAGGEEIKVGEFASLTGSEATFGQSSHKGTALAIDDLNAADGIPGKKFQLLT